MLRRCALSLLCALVLSLFLASLPAQAQERAYGRVWGGAYSQQDWERYYHYPYVYYPHSFWGNEYYRSAEDMYYRYPPEMRVPVYNKQWQNYYPQGRRWHTGHHFLLDVF